MANSMNKPTQREQKNRPSTSEQTKSPRPGAGHRAGTMADGTANREEDKSSINNRDSKFVE